MNAIGTRIKAKYLIFIFSENFLNISAYSIGYQAIFIAIGTGLLPVITIQKTQASPGNGDEY